MKSGNQLVGSIVWSIYCSCCDGWKWLKIHIQLIFVLVIWCFDNLLSIYVFAVGVDMVSNIVEHLSTRCRTSVEHFRICADISVPLFDSIRLSVDCISTPNSTILFVLLRWCSMVVRLYFDTIIAQFDFYRVR